LASLWNLRFVGDRDRNGLLVRLAAVLARIRLVRFGDHLGLAAEPGTDELEAQDRQPKREEGRNVRPDRRDLLDAQGEVERPDRERLERDRFERDRVQPDLDLREVRDVQSEA
jgi:hypothetical protein